MDSADHGPMIRTLVAAAERLDELADVAELMDDPAAAADLRRRAARDRAEALHLLDEGA